MVIKKIGRGIVIADLHYPYINKELWEAIINFIIDFKPDFIVILGDFLDMDAVNHWEIDKGNRRYMEGKRLKKNYRDFQTDILDVIEKCVGKDCKLTLMFGNHELWIEQYIDKHPELEGFAEIENNLKLERWEVIPYLQTKKIGKMYFHHGIYTTKYHASKMLDVYGKNIITGHSHDLQAITKTTPIDSNPIMAVSLPCACDVNPEYIKDKPTAWVNGFGVFYVQEDGNFNLYPVIAIKGHFVFGGRYY